MQLSEPEMLVVERIEESGSTTTAEAMALTGHTDRGAQKMLKRLIDRGVVKRVGAGKSTRYVLQGDKSPKA